MKNKKCLFLILRTIVLSAGCKCKKDVTNPKEQLPSATENGANTLGFLLNGEVWVPKGFNGTKNLSWYYDPDYSDGDLSIKAYRIFSDDDEQYFGIGGGV